MSSRVFASTLRRSASVLRGSVPRLYARNCNPLLYSVPTLINRATYSTPANQLKEVLKLELKISSSIPNELDPAYNDFLNNSGFKVIEADGKSNVQLLKETESGETIRVFFDIDEVTDIPISDPAAEEVSMDEEIDSLDSMLCNVRVLVEKPSENNGLLINLFLQGSESSFLVDFVNYQDNTAQLLNEQILKNNEFVDKFKYQGPRFSDLDESLQTSFESYLESKGIDEELADFIISYSEFKEEKEYRVWLKSLAGFL